MVPCQGRTQRGEICNRKTKSSLCAQHNPNKAPSPQPSQTRTRSRKRQHPFDSLLPISKNQRNSHTHIPFNVASSSPISISIPPLPHVTSFSLLVPCQGVTKRGNICNRRSKNGLCAQHKLDKTPPQPKYRKCQIPIDTSKIQRNSPLHYNVVSSPSPLSESSSNSSFLLPPSPSPPPSISSLLNESPPIPISIPPIPHVTPFSPLIPCQGITKRGKICTRKSKSSLCPQHDPNRPGQKRTRSGKRQPPHTAAPPLFFSSSSSLLSESPPIPIPIPPILHATFFSLLIPCQGITKRGKICTRKSKSTLCPQHDPNTTPPQATQIIPQPRKLQRPFDPLLPISKNQRNSHAPIPFNAASSTPLPSSPLTETESSTPQLPSPSSAFLPYPIAPSPSSLNVTP